jgi:hypothetical protein
MQVDSFGFLSSYFHYEHFKISDNATVKTLVKSLYKEDYVNYKYATCLVETETNSIIDVSILYTDDKSLKQIDSFNIYLNQLPSLDLSTVAFMFALVSLPDNKLLNNPFSIQDVNPSDFAKVYLKNTFGNVIYTFQLMELLHFCLPAEESSYNELNSYRKMYSTKQTTFFRKLESLCLPDGYSLYELLKTYTPLRKEHDNFGYLIKPNHKLAYLFIQKANMYVKNE